MEILPGLRPGLAYPSVRVPGLGGAAVVLSTVATPEGLERGLSGMGVDVQLMTPTYSANYGRRPVEANFIERLSQFLWAAASDVQPAVTVEPFSDDEARLSLRVLDSTDFLITLEVEIVAGDKDDTEDVDGLNFETSRAALITAAEDVSALAQRDLKRDAMPPRSARLPLDLIDAAEEKRLTGIYRIGGRLGDSDNAIGVVHYLRLGELSEAEIETSCLTSLLPFCTVAAHGVDAQRWPWVVVVQVLPIRAFTSLQAPWNAVTVAREEIRRAISRLGTIKVLGEYVATREKLIDLIRERGVDRSLIDDWTVEDLLLLGVSELANIPIAELAKGRLTGCAFPDIPHDCPKDVFDCAFGRWQELFFNVEVQDD